MSIPTVDLADFLSNDIKRKQGFVQSLGKAYEEVGFVGVKNHGITDELIRDLYTCTQQFFSLPLDHKRNYEIAKRMKEKGLPNSDIADLTGLNDDEINHL